jgi:hypothetical protein
MNLSQQEKKAKNDAKHDCIESGTHSYDCH